MQSTLKSHVKFHVTENPLPSPPDLQKKLAFFQLISGV
ncbi:hypothetical protein SC1083_1097 [Aggregatibacter actinomycetemcomitans serotype e str. SC1083]|uniref:Uncharacterized protein n=1 Tax=Aggregatibacter actinomycetemcomitans serotype e str. SC1083 TaxID=907488 RepID=G4A8E9_AGGAC|nr:hypothetical protein SC1083_1097 [Aggregatibacter actinomycetemcomitans serotype e str. SC1083]